MPGTRPTRRHDSRRGDHGEGEAEDREPKQERLQPFGFGLAGAQKRRLLRVEIVEQRSYPSRSAWPSRRERNARTVAGSDFVIAA